MRPKAVAEATGTERLADATVAEHAAGAVDAWGPAMAAAVRAEMEAAGQSTRAEALAVMAGVMGLTVGTRVGTPVAGRGVAATAEAPAVETASAAMAAAVKAMAARSEAPAAEMAACRWRHRCKSGTRQGRAP